MLLKSLKLENFRQFKGEQTIEFSTDQSKNVTIIMGDNGAGKTTLAEAFTWCLYGETSFEDKNMLCKAVVNELFPNRESSVKVEIELTHSNKNYTIVREQIYRKDNSGNLKRPENRFTISYKKEDGQQEFVDSLEIDNKIKEILPKELSRYFFFDGERIGNMSKEIRRGKSKEFADAVRSLLGLSAIESALKHLKNGVIKSYNQSYDTSTDEELRKINKEIDKIETEITEIERRLEEIEKEKIASNELCRYYEKRIEENEAAEKLVEGKNIYIKEKNSLLEKKAETISEVFKDFNKYSQGYFAKKMINDSLELLSNNKKIDKGIPDITAKTIEFLIKRGECICGNHLSIGSDHYKKLNELLEFIPPQSLGNLITYFIKDCENYTNSSQDVFKTIECKYREIREKENEILKIEEKIKLIEGKLEGLDDVGIIQKNLKDAELKIKDLEEEEREKLERKGFLGNEKERYEKKRKEYALRNKNNKNIEIYKAYAQYMYDRLEETYKEKEEETRKELERNINNIFEKIYKKGFSLLIDEKYNVRVVINEPNISKDEIETSTAQSISIIFAFIAGIIKMAREKREENNLLVSEPYPLVMDAPLSAFDKKRIQNVSDVLPNIAEQIVFFIKNTDGEIAAKHMGSKIGKIYFLNKYNEVETYIEKRG